MHNVFNGSRQEAHNHLVAFRSESSSCEQTETFSPLICKSISIRAIRGEQMNKMNNNTMNTTHTHTPETE